MHVGCDVYVPRFASLSLSLLHISIAIKGEGRETKRAALAAYYGGMVCMLKNLKSKHSN
jgi:hypothetical protein